MQTQEVNLGAIQKFMEELPEKALGFGIDILLAVFVLLIGMKAIKIVRKIVRRSMEYHKADLGVIQFIDSFLKYALYVVLFFLIASGFGLNVTSVVAVVGSAGVTIGLALQGSLSNLAGGVLILLLKPFKVGDYIIEHSGNNEGTVKEIQIFYTRLATASNHTVIIPNGILSNSSITNVSMNPVRRVDIVVGISYDADIKEARRAITAVMESETYVLQEMEKSVYVSELADSAVMLSVRCWAKSENFWNCQCNLTENVKLALDEAGIEIPFPQIHVHMAEK